jgi:hypothetical protein
MQTLSALALSCLAVSVALPVAAADDASLPKVDGWTQAGESRTFGRDNLYEYVDGAAELFLSLNFKELRVADYTNGRGGTMTVEVYRHASPLDAFGIYSQECPREGDYLRVGAEGYLALPYLNLLMGDAYVKLSADGLGERTAETLRAFADAAAQRLGGEARLPAAVALFPQDGKQPHSVRFAARDFLGYDFLRSGFTAEYAVEGRRFQLFVVEAGNAAEAQEMLRRYLDRAGQPTDSLREGSFIVADKYNGEVALAWKGRRLGGVVGLPAGTLRDRHLLSLSESLAVAP